MNILKGLNYLKVQKAYGGMVKQPFDIKGVLLNKNKNNIKVDIGNHKTIEATLKNNIKERVGDKVCIDKSQIISMRIADKSEKVKRTESSYEEILKSYGIEAKEESLDAVKELEKFEIPINKENIKKLMVAKDYFKKIKQGLTYDVAVKLDGKDMDLENESLQKVAEAVEEQKNEKDTFSFLKSLKIKKEMSTEEAQQVAKKIYDSRMGRDITNIIKALYKEGINITKKSIERVHDVFYKLGKLENMDDSNFVKVYQEGIEPTIENLYNMKYYVKEGAIAVDAIADFAVNNYEESLKTVQVSEKDLRMLEENIKDILKDIDLQVTEENMKLAKEFIRAGMPLTKENIDEVLEMKEALDELNENLDVKKASEMIRDGVNIEKEDIRKILDIIRNEEPIKKEAYDVNMNQIEKIKDQLEKLKEIKDKDLIKLLKSKVDFKLNKIEKIVFGKKDNDLMKIKDYGDLVKAKDKIQINGQGLSAQSEGENEDGLFGKENSNASDKLVIKGLNRVVNISEVFQKVKNLNFSSIAFHMSKGIPLTIQSIGENHDKLSITDIPTINESQNQEIKNYINENEKDLRVMNIPDRISNTFDAGKALFQNHLQLSISNIKHVLESYGQYNQIRKNLSTSMVIDSIREGKDLERMELKSLNQYVFEKTVNSVEKTNISDAKRFKEPIEIQENMKKEKNSSVQKMVQNISKIGKEGKDLLPLFMKNEMDFSLKEMGNVSLFLKNQQQLGNKIGELIQMIGVDYTHQHKNQILKLERLSKKVSKDIKEGVFGIDESYRELIRHIESMEKDMSFSQERDKKSMEDLTDSLSIQKKLNRKNICLQLPLSVGNQFKNLQIFMPNSSNMKGMDEPLNVLLNLDTNNLGQIHMALKIDKKDVSLKVGINEAKEKDQLEKYTKFLEDTLKQEGYTLKNVSFIVDDEGHLLEEMDEKRRGSGLLNMMI